MKFTIKLLALIFGVLMLVNFAYAETDASPSPLLTKDQLQKLILLNDNRGKRVTLRTDITNFMHLTTENGQPLEVRQYVREFPTGASISFSQLKSGYLFTGMVKNIVCVFQLDENLIVVDHAKTSADDPVTIPPVHLQLKEFNDNLTAILTTWARIVDQIPLNEINPISTPKP
jgi:hypothetical protein